MCDSCDNLARKLSEQMHSVRLLEDRCIALQSVIAAAVRLEVAIDDALVAAWSAGADGYSEHHSSCDERKAFRDALLRIGCPPGGPVNEVGDP